MTIKISKAQLDDVEQVAILFDEYRQFYGQQSDTSLAEYFIKSRIVEKSALVFVAKETNDTLCGFCLVYPSFSSLSAKRMFILNDLYVSQAYRRKGIAKSLINQVVLMARIEGVYKIELQTDKQNETARNLYENFNFKCNDQFLIYERQI